MKKIGVLFIVFILAVIVFKSETYLASSKTADLAKGRDKIKHLDEQFDVYKDQPSKQQVVSPPSLKALSILNSKLESGLVDGQNLGQHFDIKQNSDSSEMRLKMAAAIAVMEREFWNEQYDYEWSSEVLIHINDYLKAQG